MRTISVRIEFESLVEDGSYDAVETCRLTVPDDVSEIEVAEILKKAHEDKDVYKDGYCPYTLLSNINSYHRNGEIGHIGHSIFLMTQKEFSDCIDELRDGDYVFVIK